MVDEAFQARVRKVIADLLEVPEARVAPTAHFVRDLGMESVQSIELIAAFEEEFDLDIEQDDVLGILTLEKAADWLAEAIGKRGDHA